MSEPNKKPQNDGSKLVLPIVIAVSAMLVISVFIVCTALIIRSNRKVSDNVDKLNNEVQADNKAEAEEVEEQEDKDEEKETVEAREIGEFKAMTRATIVPANAEQYNDESLVPSVPAYEVKQDLSNIYNQDDIEYLSEDTKKLLARNNFVVMNYGGYEFYDVYESNRYGLTPNFVTVDSLMHTYHVYFQHLLKTIEKDELYDKLVELSKEMYDRSKQQYDELKGSEWEEAALRNVAFFTIGRTLLGDAPKEMPEVSDVVNQELKLIEAQELSTSPLFGRDEDYTQYKPRGYYEGDEVLEKYFKAMMWYGRCAFEQKKDDQMRSALLMTLAMDDSALDEWEGIYTVTSFFAGASDDATYYEFRPAIEAAYGNISYLDQLIGDEAGFNNFLKVTSELEPPKINSIPVKETDPTNVITSYRFMGQRFSIDATIFQNLIYRAVDENSNGDKRMLPDALDIPAALGSDTAYSILEDQGDTDYKNYKEKMEELRQGIADSEGTDLWNCSLYAQWLHTLRPLLNENGKGYPMFMQNHQWDVRSLEGFLGSYAELKHDTILYSKQAMAEMGGDWDEEKDDRGYVEPEPEVYSRFAVLAESTMDGLKKYDMLSKEDKQNLINLAEIAKKLVTISEKELRDETLDIKEYDFIREIGGDLEHIWADATREDGEEWVRSDEHPAAIVADVATDPNGSVLELGTGRVDKMYVVCMVDGKLKVCAGPVYSFYEFAWPMDDRLTDNQWRIKLGIWPEKEYEYNEDKSIVQPRWTQTYRGKNDW